MATSHRGVHRFRLGYNFGLVLRPKHMQEGGQSRIVRHVGSNGVSAKVLAVHWQNRSANTGEVLKSEWPGLARSTVSLVIGGACGETYQTEWCLRALLRCVGVDSLRFYQ